METYRHNVGRQVHKHDLKDIFAVAPVIGGMAPDLITGGPPCQDYSVAGKRVEGENASLTGLLQCSSVSPDRNGSPWKTFHRQPAPKRGRMDVKCWCGLDTD
ncbi:DNA cytosine methyltransferase [Brucella ovis]|uniref:DNA cytosine methyltransferase n=1 Tax=Brucella ovis TaxID=236 RepID=UPI000E203F65|nr:DNA cytosine methyltransferase [Brucella ovis]